MSTKISWKSRDLLAVGFLIVVLMMGCSRKPSCDDLVAVASSQEGREYIEDWVQREFPKDLSASELVEMDSTVGLGFYRVDVDIDWSPYLRNQKGLGVKILGEPSFPKAIVFVFETRCAIIYNLTGDSLIGVNGILEQEIGYSHGRFLVFNGGVAR